MYEDRGGAVRVAGWTFVVLSVVVFIIAMKLDTSVYGVGYKRVYNLQRGQMQVLLFTGSFFAAMTGSLLVGMARLIDVVAPSSPPVRDDSVVEAGEAGIGASSPNPGHARGDLGAAIIAIVFVFVVIVGGVFLNKKQETPSDIIANATAAIDAAADRMAAESDLNETIAAAEADLNGAIEQSR